MADEFDLSDPFLAEKYMEKHDPELIEARAAHGNSAVVLCKDTIDSITSAIVDPSDSENYQVIKNMVQTLVETQATHSFFMGAWFEITRTHRSEDGS